MDSPVVSSSTSYPPGVEMLERVGEEETDGQTVVDLEEDIFVDERLEEKATASVVPMGQGKKEKCNFSGPGGWEMTLAEEDERKLAT